MKAVAMNLFVLPSLPSLVGLLLLAGMIVLTIIVSGNRRK